MMIFHSFVYVYQKVYHHISYQIPLNAIESPLNPIKTPLMGMFHIFPKKSTVGFPRKSQVQGSDAAARAARAQRFGAHGMAVRFEKSGRWKDEGYIPEIIYTIYTYTYVYIYVVLTYICMYVM